jgi:hypothetical protein
MNPSLPRFSPSRFVSLEPELTHENRQPFSALFTGFETAENKKAFTIPSRWQSCYLVKAPMIVPGVCASKDYCVSCDTNQNVGVALNKAIKA